jgi:hypothetical protein
MRALAAAGQVVLGQHLADRPAEAICPLPGLVHLIGKAGRTCRIVGRI